MTMKTAGGHAAALLLALLPTACLQTVALDHSSTAGGAGGRGGPGAGGNNDSGAGNDGGRPVFCAGGGTASQLTYQELESSIFIALDRSSSMGKGFTSASGGNSKLAVVQATLTSLVNKFGPLKQLHFGYLEFPSTTNNGCSNANGCCFNEVSAPVNGNTARILGAIGACPNPGSGSNSGCVTADATPMIQALTQIHDEYANADPTISPRYVLLITDGEPSPNCAPSPSMNNLCLQAASEVSKLNLVKTGSVLTYVVGLGDIPGTDMMTGYDSCLDTIAAQGGFSKPAPAYYQAMVDADAQGFLTQILNGIACHFVIPAADPDKVSLSVGDITISRDPSDKTGFWSFDPQSTTNLTVYGPACNTVLASLTSTSSSGSVPKLHITGCPASSH